MLVVTGDRVLCDSKSEIGPKTIYIDPESGKITKIVDEKLSEPPNDQCEFIDAGDSLVMPGVVDAHVHVNEPGRTDWEGFATATAAAAGGGCTTLVDMPLNAIPPTTTVRNFEEKIEAAKGKCFVDVAFYGGVIPGNSDDLIPLIDRGVAGFKCFMIESGVDEFPMVTESDIRSALQRLKNKKSFLMFHAEMGSAEHPSSDCASYQTFLQSRPRKLENDAIELIVKLCSEYKTPCHIVHLSSADALPIIAKAKGEGLPLTVETCFHYLFFDSESIPNGRTEFKCCPPIRESSNKEKLWKAVLDGTIDYVVSDHSPCTATLKLFEKGDFMRAWGGIASVQFGIPAIWTAGKTRGLTFNHMVKLLCENTSKQIGFSDRKGKLRVGFDGDLAIWSPEKSFTVSKDELLFKNKVSPYVGKTLYGQVEITIVRGRRVFDSKSGLQKMKQGNLLFVK